MRPSPATGAEKPIESRFVLWFNGNGIPERYWIPSEEGARLPDDAVPARRWRRSVTTSTC